MVRTSTARKSSPVPVSTTHHGCEYRTGLEPARNKTSRILCRFPARTSACSMRCALMRNASRQIPTSRSRVTCPARLRAHAPYGAPLSAPARRKRQIMTILIPGDLFGLHDEPFERDRGFESSSLQRTVRLSPEAAFVGREPRLSARVCAAGLATWSAETRRVCRYRTKRRQYLCRARFQYRSALMWSAGMPRGPLMACLLLV